MSTTPGSHCPTCGQPKIPPASEAHSAAIVSLAQSLSTDGGWLERVKEALVPLEPILIEILRRLLERK